MDRAILLDIKKRLRLRMNGEVSASMRQFGLPYKLNYGLDALSLRELGTIYQPDVELAETLWQEPSRECRILATMLYPKQAFTMELADQWLNGCQTTELLEQLCFNLLQHLTFAGELAGRWANDPGEARRSAGYLLLLRLLLSKRIETLEDTLLEQARTDCQSQHQALRLHALRLVDNVCAR